MAFLLFSFAFCSEKNDNEITKLGLAFLLGGAVANFLERLKKHAVTDFIYLKIKRAPIFNVADIFIFLGAMMLTIKTFLTK